MRIAIAALLTLMLCAGPALAADGDGAEPPSKGTAKAACGDEAGKDCGGCKEEAGGCEDGDDDCEDGSCAKCETGAAEGKECCVAKKAAADLRVVALAVLHGEGEGAKAVLASIPADAAKKVEKARADAWSGLVKVRRAIEKTKAECKTVCEEAKAEGKEASCEVTSAYDGDVKALEKKSRVILDGLAEAVKATVGEDKVATLAAGVRKDGDVAKAVQEKVLAEASKPETAAPDAAPPAEDKAGSCSSGT